MRRLTIVLVLVCLVGLWPGCEYFDDGGMRLRVVAPDYLQALVDSAAVQFSRDNRIRVAVEYFPRDSLIEIINGRARIDAVILPQADLGKLPVGDSLYLPDSAGLFRLSMVVAGRVDGPAFTSAKDLKDEAVARVVVVDPSRGYQGMLTQAVLRKKRLWEKLGDKMILARSGPQLVSYLTTREADAAVAFESEMMQAPGLVIRDRLDKDIESWLIVCGAVNSRSQYIESARAFLDLFDSRQCATYKIKGIYRMARR